MDFSKKNISDKVGDAVEKLGTKVSDLGAKDLGKKIHDAGDRLEKSHRDPQHPVDPAVSNKTPRDI